MTPDQHTERTPRSATDGPPPIRADARRNRDRILVAARASFSESGYDVPLDEIARRAGVGAGTVYRHFPSKEAMFAAVQAERVRDLVARAQELAVTSASGEGLYAFLALLASEAEVKRDLPQTIALPSTVAGDVRAALGDLLSEAQRAGTARSDLDVDDLTALLKGLFAATGREQPRGRSDRMLAVVEAGIRSGAGRHG